MTDRELLRAYAQQGSESAFKSLVGRHVDLVFATALRGLNDAQAAEEVTQNVFITLARKGLWLSGETSVAAWLHKAALLEVRRWWRGELRRRRREQTAAELGTLMKDENCLLKALEGELDEGLLALRDADRTALILRYVEGRSHREIGALLGVREDAVRMRVGKALERLTQFFRRRGHAVPAVAITAAVLTASAKAAPAGLAAVAVGAGFAAGGSGTATGLKLTLAKFMGLTKAQTSVLCAVLAVAPVAWQWNLDRRSQDASATTRAKLELVRGQQSQASDDLRQLQAESALLDGAISNAIQNQARYEAAAAKLETLKSRVHGLLTGASAQWSEDLPYVRVPKSEVRSLDLLHKPGTFDQNGVLNDTAREMLGITAAETAPTEEALSTYWHTVLDLMNNNAYQANITAHASGQLTDTVIVPPLGEPLKTVAANTATQIADLLGPDREQILFGDWAQGGIQIFAPGNLWLIGDRAQVLDVWVRPGQGADGPSYGSSWHVDGTGVDVPNGFDLIPAGIYEKFFATWLSEHGVTQTTSHSFGN